MGSLVLTETVASGAVLSGIVTADMASGIFDEIIGLLPVLVPVMVGFIAIRKGLGFLTSTLHNA